MADREKVIWDAGRELVVEVSERLAKDKLDTHELAEVFALASAFLVESVRYREGEDEGKKLRRRVIERIKDQRLKLAMGTSRREVN